MATTNFNSLIETLQLQAANLPTYQAALGVSNQMLADVSDDLADLEYIRDYSDVIDTDKKAVIAIKQAIYNGDPNVPVSAFPTFPIAGPPNSPPQGGCLERFQDRNRFFKAAPGYTEEIGTALGIAGGGAPTNPGGVTPTISVEAAQSGSMFSCVVSGRGDSDSWSVQILRSGSDTWETVGTFTGKSADVHITLTVPGKPEQMQVRVQLRKANAPYGNTSQAATVTVNP